MDIEYRKAEMMDLAGVIEFVDYWLAGRGFADHAKGVVNDYFISHKQHFDYIQRYFVLLGLDADKIVGWGVRNNHNVLIGLLVAGDHRGCGIGGEILRLLHPDMIRSKMDQSTGDPAGFYEKHGFVPAGTKLIGKKENIQLFTKVNPTL